MPAISVSGVNIYGVSAVVPPTVVRNEDYALEIGLENSDRIIKSIGVEERRVAGRSVCTSDLCTEAAGKLLAKLEWAPESVDGLIFVSQTADLRLPATSCILQNRLGLSSDCLTFDINMGCSGYTHGLQVAGSLVAAGLSRVLLLVGDTSSKLVNPTDHSTALLFGDAGTATAIGQGDGVLHCVSGTDGAGAEHLIMKNEPGAMREVLDDSGISGLHMDGAQVFGFTLKRVPQLILSVLQHAKLQVADVDAFVLHQANAFMLNHIRKKAKISEEKFLVAMKSYGNTSSASIPLTLAAASRAGNAPGGLVCMAGFGVGLSWSAVIADFSQAVVLPVEELNNDI